MGLARKMKRKDERPNIKEKKRQIAISAKANRLANDLNRQIEKDRYTAEVMAIYNRLENAQDALDKLCDAMDWRFCGEQQEVGFVD